jgi:serine protease Do
MRAQPPGGPESCWGASRASGSGVIVDPEGYIVTNAHVVAGAQSIRVRMTSAPRAEEGALFDQSIMRVLADALIPAKELRLQHFLMYTCANRRILA